MGKFDHAPVDRAAGGIVFDDEGRIVVVHRARYDDWSLPKGHVDAGESWAEAALREVREETGVVADLLTGPHPLAYALPDGIPKIVVFFTMQATGIGAVETPDEVDEVAWWTPEMALSYLSYDVERALVAELG